jgi:hypothetical protein
MRKNERIKENLKRSNGRIVAQACAIMSRPLRLHRTSPPNFPMPWLTNNFNFCEARLSARAGTDGNGTGRQKKSERKKKWRGQGWGE